MSDKDWDWMRREDMYRKADHYHKELEKDNAERLIIKWGSAILACVAIVFLVAYML